MKLTNEEYKALEDIVGPEYITQEPVIMESYNQVWGNKLAFGDKRHNPPAAVLLPANTEEIQAIVKYCNKAGILFKASARAFEYVATKLSQRAGHPSGIKADEPDSGNRCQEHACRCRALRYGMGAAECRRQGWSLHRETRCGIHRLGNFPGLLPSGDDHLPALYQRLRAQRSGL